jgi:3-oxochol-4-en-24-oyl-CoA dehydrogenase
MTIALSAEHQELGATVRAFLRGEKARAATRATLDVAAENLPAFWAGFAELGMLGVHLPEQYGGGGYGLPELAVVVEELGRAVAPGPFLPTMLASAVIAASGDDAQRQRYLPSLADGSVPAALGLGGSLRLEAGSATGDAGVVLGVGLAGLLVLAAGEDLVVLPADAPGLSIELPPSLDTSRRSGQVRLADVQVTDEQILRGARRDAETIARALVAAEAAGGARECVETAAEYAKVRVQFGRPIAMFEAVKHHCANMLVDAELATATAWDAARAVAEAGDNTEAGDSAAGELAAAAALAVAVPAFIRVAQLNIQVHGGIGFTWEHDAHLLLRRANTLAAIFGPDRAAADVTRLVAAGVRRAPGLDLPPEVEARRAEVRQEIAGIAALPADQQRAAMIETGYFLPGWPRPYGLEADAALQVLIRQEFQAADVTRPGLGITTWLIRTLIQYGTPEQTQQWVGPALAGDDVWCQLFSEPDAGSDAAAVRTRAVHTETGGPDGESGWVLNGQKLWTSDAQHASWGLATVRTDPDAPKHAGITAVVVDMHGPGVEVRPLRQITGETDFNEVYLTDVFVPDSHVVGDVNSGWAVARATFANERMNIGSGMGLRDDPAVQVELLRLAAATPSAEVSIGYHLAEEQGLRLLNLRTAERAVTGAGPGPEGNLTKLVLSDHLLRAADLLANLSGAKTAFADGLAARAVLGARALSIAGGTSEITRNQIAERILGLPRDPLIK